MSPGTDTVNVTGVTTPFWRSPTSLVPDFTSIAVSLAMSVAFAFFAVGTTSSGSFASLTSWTVSCVVVPGVSVGSGVYVSKRGLSAVAPTATISTIAGTSPSIEPVYSNLYVKSNMSGDFTIVNEQLVADLKARDLWDDQLRDQLTYHDGSIQEIDRVPDDLKRLYRGAFEIDPRHQLKLAAVRGQWIDQSQSVNVFFPSTDGSKLNEVYQTAWEYGLKTTYYLRTLGASQIEKTTLDMAEYDDTQTRDESEDEQRKDHDAPTVEDPTCDACQ